MTIELDKTHRKWHSIHTIRQGRYQTAVPGLIRATKLGDKTEIDDRLVHFARTFQTPQPLSAYVSLGFYDKKSLHPEEVSYLLTHAGYTLIQLMCPGGPTRFCLGVEL